MPRVRSALERLLAPLLADAVDRRVREAVDEHRAAASHVPPNDLLEHQLVYGDRAKLHVHPSAVLNNALFNLSSGEITIEEWAFFGHSVSVLTGTHDVLTFDRERQVAVPKTGRDVVIGRGAWVSSNALILGPCRIGEHAVVAAGAVVTGDVPALTVVAGAPARAVRTIPPPGSPPGTPLRRVEPPPTRFDRLLPAFQDRFRGSEADVRQRLSAYLSDVQAAATGRAVCDLGPGRGEWVAVLQEHGITAYGVEASAAMVEHLRGRGLEVVHGDATAHLRSVDPGQLDAVSAIHVVEHLDVEALLGLLAAARRALRPGGLLLLETPDPTNLVMGACNFRLDPTHRQPLPPALLEFLVSASGFADVQVRRLHPKEDVDLSGLRLDGVEPRASQLVADALARGIFGTQDYAVLATAPDA